MRLRRLESSRFTRDVGLPPFYFYLVVGLPKKLEIVLVKLWETIITSKIQKISTKKPPFKNNCIFSKCYPLSF